MKKKLLRFKLGGCHVTDMTVFILINKESLTRNCMKNIQLN